MSVGGFADPNRPRAPAEVDPSMPHPARVYDHWLGGKDNFEADREVAEAVSRLYPTIKTAARENRAFLRRAVSFLAEQGINQFLDIGTGIPAMDNTHEVAQRVEPSSRVVYVDNDPIVLAHARALLRSGAQGVTAYIDADLREPATILDHPELKRTLDLSEPVGLLMLMILQLVDADDLYGVVRTLVEGLPSGSHVAISHLTADFMPAKVGAELVATYRHAGMYLTVKDQDGVARFFDGLKLVSPGVVPITDWRAEDEPDPRPTPAEASVYGAVGRKR